MKCPFVFGCCLVIAAFEGARAQEIHLAAGDSLVFAPNGAWRSATLGGRPLPITADAPLVSVCDVDRGDAYAPLLGTVRADRGGVQMALGSEPLALKATLAVSADGAAARFKLRIEDASGRDRGLLVRISVPVNAIGWHWWDDIERRRTIEPDRLYEDVKPLRAFAALPEWKDKPDLRMGFNTANFCTVISGPVGLCLAVPLDQPRIFRTGYDGRQKTLSITYDVALCRETAPPSQAAFEFELFGCDPEWGARGALDSYYQRHAGSFAKHLKNEGMWIAFTRLNEIDNVSEFGVAIQEGAASCAYDDKIGVQSFSYYTHAGIYADVPNHKRGVDPTPTLERRIAAVEANLKRSTGRDGAYAECGLYNAAGQLSAEPGSVYGDVLAQFCLEPELFYGNWLLERIESFFDGYRKRGGELDGFYYDGLTTGINYRRDHFRHASYPPAWDPVAKKPYLYNYFSSVEWARLVADKLHAMGKATMMNGAMGATPFCAPYLDVMGAETGLNIPLADFNFVKSVCRHKTFATLLKGNYAKLGSAEIELFMKRCLAYGVFPGYFDWPPSGLGPGGTYWDHAEYYERDRLLFRKYQPLVKQIAAAGWEPLTFARAANPTLHVERFGREYFTVLNDSDEPARSSLTIAADRLKLPVHDLVVFDEVAARHIPCDRKEASLTLPLDLPPRSVALLHIATRADFTARHLEAAAKLFETAEDQRKADNGRPARPMYWKVTEQQCLRDDGALLLRDDTDKQSASASQWVMLFQTEARPITIRARVKTRDVGGKKRDAFALQAIVCYVDNRFTTRDPRTRPLEPGDGEWRRLEWTIEPERPVRSIQLTLRFNGRGSAWFEDVSVRSAEAPDRECVVDGGFDAWYERLTAEQDALLAPSLASVRSAISDRRAPPDKRLTEALGAVQAASAVITKNHLENPARRALRDLGEAGRQLAACVQPVLHVEGLTLTAPERVAPGETVTVTAQALAAKGVVRRAEIALWSEGGQLADGQLAIPANAKPGSVVELCAEAAIELAAGGLLRLRAARTIAVTRPFDAEAVLDGVNATDDSQTIALQLTNNRSRPQRFTVAVDAPAGWTVKEFNQQQTVAPQSCAAVKLTLTPAAAVKTGHHCVVLTVQGDGESQTVRLELSHAPASANRLKNPGFESSDAKGLSNWSPWQGGCAADASVSRSGRHSLRLQTNDEHTYVGASQGVALNQTKAAPLIVRGWCKTEKVRGSRSGCCLYVDIYYVDGTKLYGQKVIFDGGTHDWQLRETRIETSKPARNASFYAMLQGAAGTAWFDDALLAEDLAPPGNRTPTAK